MTAPRGAVFLDRDGTLVSDPGYLHDPAAVRLLPGVGPGLRRLADAGWPLVVVSNQSGIARGIHDAAAFQAVMDRIQTLLEPDGVRLRAWYFCPHLPDITGPCRCRKPGTLLFERAAADLVLDPAGSWFVGDRVRDAEPALALGGRGIVVSRTEAETGEARRRGLVVVRDFAEAAAVIVDG